MWHLKILFLMAWCGLCLFLTWLLTRIIGPVRPTMRVLGAARKANNRLAHLLAERKSTHKYM